MIPLRILMKVGKKMRRTCDKPGDTTATNTRSAASQGEQDFDRMYRENAARVFGYLRRLTGGDRDTAEDLTQEVFLAAYRGQDGYTGRVPLIAWLLGIARRRWRDAERGASPGSVALPEEATCAACVEEQVVRATYLERCLAQLDPAARDAIVLVFGEGCSYAEAAALLGEPIGTVKWRVHSARRALQEMLGSTEEDPE
jgi:RNA polymerase sigma-70 factor (ECF subfamily)